MYNNIQIGAKTVPMMSVASVDVYYREIFHDDPIKIQANAEQDAGAMVDFVMKMGFVMAKFVELKDRKAILKLTLMDYIEWLDEFDRVELLNALEDIQKTYEGQAVTTSEAKKNNEEQTGN